MRTKGGSGKVGMFTQRVKAAWPCLGLDVQSEPCRWAVAYVNGPIDNNSLTLFKANYFNN